MTLRKLTDSTSYLILYDTDSDALHRLYCIVLANICKQPNFVTKGFGIIGVGRQPNHLWPSGAAPRNRARSTVPTRSDIIEMVDESVGRMDGDRFAAHTCGTG
jgi:hypothetical protein